MFGWFDHLEEREKVRAAGIGAIIIFLVETGLQVSGITNLPLAVCLWSVAGVLSLYWQSHFKTKIRFDPHALIIAGFCIIAAYGLWRDTGSKVPDLQHSTPSVLLLPERDRLVLYNRSNADIYLWGDKFDDETAPTVETQRRTIPFGGFYYFLTDKLEAQAKVVIGENGEKLEPFEVYISDKSDRRYIAKFDLLIKMKDSSMTVHTQQLGVSEGNWR
jgi:hypothetical protein